MAVFRTLEDMGDVRGKRVLVRSELNTPIEHGAVSDTYRIEKAVPTLKWLSGRGARVIVMAHLGRNPSDSLKPVYAVLSTLIPHAQFVADVVGEEAQSAVMGLEDGEVLLLENLRSHPGEKENNPEFAKILASYADYYVDDAFGNAHRADASMVSVPALIPSFAGLCMEQELTELKKGLTPESPSLFILGGAKFETKEALLEAILPRYDTVYIGGALANDFLKAQGFEVGQSLISENAEKAGALLVSGKLLFPKDVLVKNKNGTETKHVEEVGVEDTIVDIGPESITELCERIQGAKCVLWNGPMGLFEEGYVESTKQIVEHIANADGYSIVGGGDTVAAIRELKLEDKMGFLSTGGGAMLDYLVDGKLPGVEALESAPTRS
ncbi:MAG: Phosphoglycerate kinase [Parcubacteria group bacterium GW2011_GWD2_42_14]|nr:MAG: Phosphoglycerate kinase [Parcubacteria group bacterium GW2011_GWD2_42_14]